MEYNEALEFLIENGIQLDRDQMNELRNIYRKRKNLDNIIDERMKKLKRLEDENKKSSRVIIDRREPLPDSSKAIIDRIRYNDKDKINKLLK